MIEKHRSFAANHNLPMRLLSESPGKAVRDYDMKNLIGARRGVIVIDKEGVIRKIMADFPWAWKEEG